VGLYRFPLRVYLEDTDAGGIVFYANYLKFFERARTEFVRSYGFEMRRSLNDGISFVVAELAMKYRASAYLDDELDVCVQSLELRNSYFRVHQWVERRSEPGKRLVEGEVKVACVDLMSGRPRKMPASLSAALRADLEK
jgi:tol-pal system-associated acyl-CoA thioesterase